MHTPGPWETRRSRTPDNTGGYDYAIVDKDKQIIAEAFEHTDKESCDFVKAPVEANARLIAAAPDLLSACKEALSAFYQNDIEDAKSALKMAIAKAEGSGPIEVPK